MYLRRTEENFVALLPHLCYQCLTGINDTSEARFDVLERTKGLQDVLPREAERGETMKDGLVETAEGSKFGLDL